MHSIFIASAQDAEVLVLPLQANKHFERVKLETTGNDPERLRKARKWLR